MFSVASVRCSLFSLNSNREQPLVPASLSKTLRSLNLEPYQISRPSYRRLNATSASLVCIFLTSSLFPCTKDFKNLTGQPRITRRYYFFHWMIPKKELFSSSSFTFFVFVFVVLLRRLPHLCLSIWIKSMVLVYVSFCLTCLFLSPNPVLAGSRISESGPADFPKEEGA